MPPCSPPRILIVDDHASFRRSARRLLEHRGYEVLGEAVDAATALEAVERDAPDGVLLDVQLGRDNGFVVCTALKRARPGLAVLLVSSADCRSADGLLEASGACGFLLKTELATADLARIWQR